VLRKDGRPQGEGRPLVGAGVTGGGSWGRRWELGRHRTPVGARLVKEDE
jgi:hypothetical protein